MLTGRHVLIWFLGFFAVVFGVNGVFTYLAVTTFDGADVPNPYVGGRSYEGEISAAAAQKQRAWQVTLRHESAADGQLNLAMNAKDAAGRSITGLRVEANFKRPTLATLDFSAPLREVEAGHYRQTVTLPEKGQWILQLSAYRANRRVYRTENRVIVE